MDTTWIFIFILLGFTIYLLAKRFITPKYLKELTQDEFIQGYRKAQLIDVREPGEYEAGHILGARNIPMSQLRQRMNEVRSDQPVYLYCNSGARSKQVAAILKKKRNCEELYHLKTGFKKWTGKVKKK